MASPFWLGIAATVAQVWKGSVTDITAGHTYTLPVTDEGGASLAFSYTVQAGDTTTTILAASIAAAWAASSDPRLTAIAATSSTNQFILTATIAGQPFYIGTPAGTGTWTGTGTTTANSGPNDYNVALNWSTGVVPVSTDSVTVDNRGAANGGIQFGLNQSAVTLASLRVLPGAPPTGQAIPALRISATAVDVPDAQGSNASGVTRLNLDLGTNAATVNVQLTGTPIDAGFEPVRITGAHASNVLVVGGGAVVGLGTNKPSDAPQFPSITVGAPSVSPMLNTGPGLVAGAACTLISGRVNANHRPGGNTFGTLTLAGISTTNPPVVDFSAEDAAVTIATLAIKGSGSIKTASDTQATYTATTITLGSYRTVKYSFA